MKPGVDLVLIVKVRWLNSDLTPRVISECDCVHAIFVMDDMLLSLVHS